MQQIYNSFKLAWHITKRFMIGKIPSNNFTCQRTGEPIMVNPNSSDRVQHILHEYTLLVGREWVVIFLGWQVSLRIKNHIGLSCNFS